jgi:hypothetical protein
MKKCIKDKRSSLFSHSVTELKSKVTLTLNGFLGFKKVLLGTTTVKLFTSVINYVTTKLKHTLVEPFRTQLYTTSHPHRYWTRVEVSCTKEHTSLLHSVINYLSKKFYSKGSRFLTKSQRMNY